MHLVKPYVYVLLMEPTRVSAVRLWLFARRGISLASFMYAGPLCLNGWSSTEKKPERPCLLTAIVPAHMDTECRVMAGDDAMG